MTPTSADARRSVSPWRPGGPVRSFAALGMAPKEIERGAFLNAQAAHTNGLKQQLRREQFSTLATLCAITFCTSSITVTLGAAMPLLLHQGPHDSAALSSPGGVGAVLALGSVAEGAGVLGWGLFFDSGGAGAIVTLTSLAVAALAGVSFGDGSGVALCMLWGAARFCLAGASIAALRVLHSWFPAEASRTMHG
jgi:hypothetical protein